ncbi:MAG: antibiotic biosynthesis monooxygenase [Gemmataceae bacterium]|nr:antibiotic biosynthesis monooxygenase [Gemmataceae bacterium]
MIHVIATIELAEGQREVFLEEFRQIVPLVRAEAGCLEYGPALDVPTGIAAQAPLRENVVLVVEKWESVEALKAHLQAPHMLAYRPRVKDLVVRTTLHVLGPA